MRDKWIGALVAAGALAVLTEILMPRRQTARVIQSTMDTYSAVLRAMVDGDACSESLHAPRPDLWTIPGNGIPDPYMLRDPGVW